MAFIIQIFLFVLLVLYLYVFLKDVWQCKKELKNDGTFKNVFNFMMGFVTNFFDALGIGSFAPQTILIKMFKLTRDDSYIPGTLNIANTTPVLFQGLIFITLVEVEALTLAVLLITSIIGGIVGARIISRLPVKKIQFVIACALAATAILMALRQSGTIDLLGQGNTALGLSGITLILAAIGTFLCGVGQSMGVGFYAPCMAIVYFAGMDPLAAFPIMMGSCAAVMPMSSITFVKEGKYEKIMSILIMIGGTIGVAIAAFIVKSLNKDMLVWLVVVVVIIASITTFKQALTKENTAATA